MKDNKQGGRERERKRERENNEFGKNFILRV